MLEELTEQIKAAGSSGTALHIVGGGSKSFYGRDLSQLPVLSTGGLNQLVSFEPSELVVQVQAGFPIKDLVDMLARENQMLAFDPPDFGDSTIGGVIASGISGSRRPFQGAVRDFVLGVSMIDGQGKPLVFGGQVMKNVAGYDVSRLMVGSLGCLGVITEVSLKVLPRPEVEKTLCKPIARTDVLSQMRKLSQQPETSGLAYWQGKMYVRFSGSEPSVKTSSETFAGEQIENAFWQQLDNLQLFAHEPDLWRVSTRANDSTFSLDDAALIDWGGAQRWFTNGRPEQGAGHITHVKTSDVNADIFSPLPAYLLKVHKKLKAAFDPFGVLNPGKMYPDF